MKSCCTCFYEQKCPVSGTAGPGIPNPGLKTVQSEWRQTWEMSRLSCSMKSREVGNDVVMFPKAHAEIWGVFSCWLSGTGHGTKLAVIRGLPEETSNVPGNYLLALNGRCLWRLCAGFCYQEQNAGRGEPRVYSISCGFLMWYTLILCRRSKFQTGTSVQSEGVQGLFL